MRISSQPNDEPTLIESDVPMLNAVSGVITISADTVLHEAGNQLVAVVENIPEWNATCSESLSVYANLLRKAQSLSRPGVSGRRVGAIAIGESGKAYLGGNIEIRGGAPSDTIHAEVFALALAKVHGERGISQMVQTLQPCGSCRQVLAEVGNPSMVLHIVEPDTLAVASFQMGELFPFGYSYATPTMNLFKPPTLESHFSHTGFSLMDVPLGNSLRRKAIEAAFASYLPRPERKAWSGLAAETISGRIYQCAAMSISGANPTITPVQNLLIQMAANQQEPRELESVVLVEPIDPDYSFHKNTMEVLAQLAPHVVFRHEALGALDLA